MDFDDMMQDPAGPAGPSVPEGTEQVYNIGKLLRVGGMMREMLDEARRDSLDAEARKRATELLARCVGELKAAISPDLQAELDRINLPFDAVPTQSELRLTEAQLVGWFEGLFHGMQASIMGQQQAAGQVPHPLRRPGPQSPDRPPGQYL